MEAFAQYKSSTTSWETLPSSATFTLTSYPNNKQRTNIHPTSAVPAVPAPLFEDSPEPVKRGRRGHTKSRGGCSNCKRLKIKCKENRPDCDYCAHRGLKCQWPKIPVKQAQIGAVIRKPMAAAATAATVPLAFAFQSEGPLFNMQDFRLFNHFIQRAYPHHPSGNDSVWKHEIPCLASNYDYLLYSMLALSASELAHTDICPHKMRNTALAHRTKSITALNAAVQRGVNSLEEGNAMLATCFSLLFQSTLIADGLVEYMTFIRGTNVVATQMCFKKMRPLFHMFPEDERLQSVKSMIEDAPIIQPDIVQGACRSLEKSRSLCQTKLELQVYALLFDIAQSLVTCSEDAYFKLRKVYKHFSCTMSHSDFRYYCEPSNQVCKILQAHFVALQLIMNPITKKEKEPTAPKCPVKEGSRAATSGWLGALHRDVPLGWAKYYVWTMWVEREVCGGRVFDGSVGITTCKFDEGLE